MNIGLASDVKPGIVIGMPLSDNEAWLEQEAEAVKAQRLAMPQVDLLSRDRLIEIVWLVSQSMRTTGDLAVARHSDPSFLKTGRLIAHDLDLPTALTAFSGSEAALERQFFELFAPLCRELRQLNQAPAALSR